MLLEMQSQLMRRLDTLTRRRRGATEPSHLVTGNRGEREALFHLRKHGYIVVATRWKTPKLWGDVDLIAWEKATLCFIEVKTRTRQDVAIAEAAVDGDKQQMLQKMARAYLRRFPEKTRDRVPVRFDVVIVYLLPSGTVIDVHRGAFDRH